MTIERTTFAFTDYEVRSKGDGRTLVGLAAPFDVEVNTGRGYREVFRRGAFAKTIKDGRPERIKLMVEHGKESRLPLGAAKVLTETHEGLVGEFKVSRTRAGDEALALIEDGALDSLSIGFVPIVPRAGIRIERGSVVERREVALREVSLVTDPAYLDARVLAIREHGDTTPEAGMTLAEARRIAICL